MSVLDETSRDVSRLPGDAKGLRSADWRLIADIERRFSAELQEVVSSLRRFETVSELSRQIEKEWYRAAIVRAQALVAAEAVFEKWWVSARVDSSSLRRTARQRRRAHRGYVKLQKAVERVGDPTAPRWAPPRRYRLRTYAKSGRWR